MELNNVCETNMIIEFTEPFQLEGKYILTEYLQLYIETLNEYIKKTKGSTEVMEEWIRKEMLPEFISVLLTLNTENQKSINILKAIIALTKNELEDDRNESIDLYDAHYRLMNRIQHHLTMP